LKNTHQEIEGIDASTLAGKAVDAVKTKARGIFGEDFISFTLIEFVSFMILNNKLASNGIFITDENKEEKYIEIIETGNTDLIADLEEYITLLDNIKKIQETKNEYDGIIEALKCLEDYNDAKDVTDTVKDYLRR